ncbi:glycosyltransferase family 1 protein [Aerophototrophica crusticola]|uniref:Glycosyltransferase family 1 protein n=1 Tax=Aerophototrophica crusticola TaxID=1709002 RepID=A0A858R533_9PROT|nr:glycosyltransferase family 1 protein [Rhodospirillaceae bacterium B3]
MIVTVTALGSRGDVQPFAALAVALAGRGHEVRLVTHAQFEGLVAGRGVTLHPVTGNIQDDLDSEAGRRMFDEGASPVAVAGAMRDMVKRYASEWALIGREASRGADVLVPGGGSALTATAVSEAWGIPYVAAYPQPLYPTSAFPSPLVPPPRRPLPGLAYKLQHHVLGQFFWQMMRPGTNLGRQAAFGLGPEPFFGPFGRMRREKRPILMCYSRHVVPVPTDWPNHVHVTGYWWLEEPSWTLPPELARFLESGPPPVYVGFGSMKPRDPKATTDLLLAAIGKAGCRAVLASGWGGLGAADLPDTVFPLAAAPHGQLFPHMAAIVHHGGAGTTGATVRSGKPGVHVPFLADQFFWAWRTGQLGISGGSVPYRSLDADTLAAAIRRALDDQGIRARAAALGEKVRAEDGLGEAVRVVEAVAGARRAA